ncbi:MAG TPA: oxidoreductase [Candidatus Latescibacteria bacterium]|nr:oxidoreductase [Candidatus Latescibacterota bacterium]
MERPRIGIFKYSCCAGCQFQLIYFQEHLLETFGAVDIVYGRMETSAGSEEGPFDVVLIEGAITESKQADQLKAVRGRSKYLVPIGSCAVNGGIPAIKNLTPELEVEQRVYSRIEPIHSVRAHPADEYVRVDAYLRGCPVGETDLIELVTALLLGTRPRMIDYCVCVECKRRGNTCILVAEGAPCMGPVTNAGCGALCPSNHRSCYACWGPMPGANAPALARKFEAMGMPPDEIVRRFTEFGCPTLEFRKGAELYE